MAEALTSVRGFYTTNDRNYTYVGVRGFGRPSDYNNRVLVLVNGHRFNDNVYDQALLGNDFPVDLALVQRIEIDPRPRLGALRDERVLRGHQRRAASGERRRRQRVDARGRQPRHLPRPHVLRHAARVGRRRAVFGDADDHQRPGADLLPGVRRARDRQRLSRDADGESSTSLFGSFTRGRFALQGVWNSRDKDIPTGAYGTELDNSSRTTDSRFWIDATMTGSFKGAALTARAFTDYSGYRGTYHYVDAAGLGGDSADGAWAGAEGIASKRLGPRHQLTTGLEYPRRTSARISATGTPSRTSTTSTPATARTRRRSTPRTKSRCTAISPPRSAPATTGGA